MRPLRRIGTVFAAAVLSPFGLGSAFAGHQDQCKAFCKCRNKKQQKAYQDKERKLREQKASLSEAEFKQKVADLNAQTDKAEEALTQKKRALDSGVKKAVGQIRKSLLEIVADIAKKRGLTMVLDKSTVPLSHKDFDFTEEAMKGLDAKLPSVKFCSEPLMASLNKRYIEAVFVKAAFMNKIDKSNQ